MRIAAVAIGSNLGDRAAHVDFAREQLARFLHRSRVSSTFETEPVGVPGRQPPFLNAAVVGATAFGARELLRELLAIEAARGRERPSARAPRTLDLDLILLGDVQVDEIGLRVPHPRFRERRFVLEPLAEIAPDIRDPETGLTIRELLAALGPGEAP